ncbi:stage II sporulation protein P [bacterium 210820-DFI.6.37]|nr:stage II sporulation protein P [bacterium 210820-DFI.6.37]
MNRKTLAALCAFCFILSTLFFWQRLGSGRLPEIKLDGEQLGKLCVAQVYPAISRGSERTPMKTADKAADETATKANKPSEQTNEPEKKNTGADNSKPLVIIYHTHTTESYQPYDESNFHREKETGTVRDVGNVMTEELNSLGIGVVHDKTIHDRPSYNESYDRSLETVTALQKKYPTAKYIIDLHRDAAAYAGNVGKTTKINGETVAKFSLVVGQNNANFSKLKAYANKINKKAESMYKGFGGSVIEKTYRYNEYIADNYLLLEIGNNQNDIKQVKATGKYFARVLASVIEDER